MTAELPRVFVPQRQPNLDMTSARDYGELRVMFDSIDYNDASQLYVEKAKSFLTQEFAPGDYLVLVGDMVLAAICFKIMADLDGTGTVKCLKWDRHKKCYYPIILTNLEMEETYV